MAPTSLQICARFIWVHKNKVKITGFPNRNQKVFAPPLHHLKEQQVTKLQAELEGETKAERWMKTDSWSSKDNSVWDCGISVESCDIQCCIHQTSVSLFRLPHQPVSCRPLRVIRRFIHGTEITLKPTSLHHFIWSTLLNRQMIKTSNIKKSNKN